MTNEEESILIAVVQYFRHGDRTPAYPYPNDPYGEEAYWPYEMGVLTNKGIQEMYDLGKFTRQRYKHFLPSLYPIKNLHIYTTAKVRTIQSAQAYSAGLYPPPKELIWNEKIPWTPIPTYKADPYLLTDEAKYVSPAYARDLTKQMAEYIEKFKKDHDLEYISANSGMEITDFIMLTFLFDTLTIQESMGLKLPEWTKKVYPNTKVRFDTLQCVCKTKMMKRLYVGPQLHEIIQYFEKMIKDSTSGPKLLVFSGHDANVVAVLDTFGAYEPHAPINGSSLFIELRRKNGEHYVNVFYKQKDVVPIRVLGADFDCKFEIFKTSLADYTISKEQYYQEYV